MKHEKLYSFTLFPCFFFRLLRLWFVFLDSVSVLRFNFVFFFGVCFLLGTLISVWGFVFVFWYCFSVLGFRFVLYVSVLGLFSSIFVVVVLWFFCFYRPPYIFESPLHLNPTTGEHFNTPQAFLGALVFLPSPQTAFVGRDEIRAPLKTPAGRLPPTVRKKEHFF